MSGIRKIINSPLVPKLPGAYNQAVQAGNVLYVSGSLGLDEKTLKPVKGGAAAEARQSLKNIHAILKHAGTSFDKNIKHVYSRSAVHDLNTIQTEWKSMKILIKDDDKKKLLLLAVDEFWHTISKLKDYSDNLRSYTI